MSERTTDRVKPVDETGHTKLETLLARALWQHSYLLSTLYLNLGKKNMPIFWEMQERMKAIPTREQRWLNSRAITDGQGQADDA